MKAGKVPIDLLQRIVYPHLGCRPDVLVHAKVGEDCAILDYGDYVCVATTDPITAAARHVGRLAVHVACNDLAATGAEPVALLLTVLQPVGAALEELEALMGEAGEAATGLGIEIAGGHTEVTPGLPHTLVVMTALGRARKGEYVSTSGARPGDALLLTKAAGIEGTAILASDMESFLAPRLGAEVVARGKDFVRMLSVVPEGRLAVRAGATAMHDAVEGGIVSAAWEMAEASGVGVELWVEEIPVLPETRAICEVFGADPLGLISSGALLIASGRPQETRAALEEAGIAAATIGHFADGPRVLRRGGRLEPLQPFPRDELWRILDEFSSEGEGAGTFHPCA
ncbi:MAG: AIR synthase [Armatimonadetes bacterium]|nr:AIR synthase [Armatimonadota bacterium]